MFDNMMAWFMMIYATNNLRCPDSIGAVTCTATLRMLHATVVLYEGGSHPRGIDTLLAGLSHGGHFPVAILALQKLDQETLFALGLDQKDPKRQVFYNPAIAGTDTSVLLAEHEDAIHAKSEITHLIKEMLLPYFGAVPVGVIILREEPDEWFLSACAQLLPCLEAAGAPTASDVCAIK